MKDDRGIAIGLLGVTMITTIQIYAQTAPSLKDLRAARPNDLVHAQLLLDADVLGLIVVLAAGGSGAMIIRKWWPLLAAGAALLLMSAYYRAVYNAPSVGEEVY
jgi:hypothetical protein